MTEEVTYGLLIQRFHRYGSEHVSAKVMQKKPGDDFPTHIGSFSSWDGRWDLADLGIYGMVSDGSFGKPEHFLCGSGIEWEDTGRVPLGRAKAMAKMAAKIEKALSAEDAREPGDMFMVLAKIAGARWVAMPRGGEPNGSSSLRDERWVWYTVPEGRNRYRQLIQEAEEAVRKRIGWKPKAEMSEAA
jgi:hypothetical protein